MNKKYRRCIIAGNWKMNCTPSQVRGFVEELRGAMPASLRGCSVVLCVPATHLHALSSLRSRRIAVGAQNVSEFESGAHTGEISAEMLRDLDVRYCIVGHSERRQDNHETDKMVSAKVCALLDKPPEALVTAEDVALILSHPRGGRKGVTGDMAFRCVLNKADTPERLAAAREIAALLAERGIPVAITRYAEGERGGRELF